jgi:hypothetical protein
MMHETAAAFAAVFAALYAAHTFGDHWIQTHGQACAKGAPGRAGQIACARHVITLTMTKLVFLLALVAATGLELAPLSMFISLAVDAVSHYWADRAARHKDRPADQPVTLERLARRLRKGDFYRLGAPRDGHDDAPHLGTGAYALDQSWHVAWLFVAALVMAA